MNVAPLGEDELFLRALKVVSERRREKVLRHKKRSDAALSLGAGILLSFALKRDFGISELPEINVTEHGKPYFAGRLDIRFNLSHSGEYVACVISSECDVGVDIQLVRRCDMRSAKRVFSKAVYAELERAGESERNERFTELWVLHESSVKLPGGTVFDTGDGARSTLIAAPAGYKIAVALK